MKVKFCPNCHKKMVIPAFVEQLNDSVNVNLECGNCKKGKVFLEAKNPPKVIRETFWGKLKKKLWKHTT